MARYLFQRRDLQQAIDFLSFASMGKNIGKNINENFSCKYSKKLLDHAKQPATDVLRTASRKAIPKTAKAVCE